jgi:hypothetical protein
MSLTLWQSPLGHQTVVTASSPPPSSHPQSSRLFPLSPSTSFSASPSPSLVNVPVSILVEEFFGDIKRLARTIEYMEAGGRIEI